jgi:hypothetical protein
LSFDFYYNIVYTELLPLYYEDDWFVEQNATVRVEFEGNLGLQDPVYALDFEILPGGSYTTLVLYSHRSTLFSTYVGGLPGQWQTLQYDLRETLLHLGGVDMGSILNAKINSIRLEGDITGGRFTFFDATYGFDNVFLLNQ